MFVNYDEWGGFFDHVAPRARPRRPAEPQPRRELRHHRLPHPRRGDLAVGAARARQPHGGHARVDPEADRLPVRPRLPEHAAPLRVRTSAARSTGSIRTTTVPTCRSPRRRPPPPVRRRRGSDGAGAWTRQRERPRRPRASNRLLRDRSTYREALGYPTAPTDPERIFAQPGRTRKRLGVAVARGRRAGGCGRRSWSPSPWRVGRSALREPASAAADVPALQPRLHHRPRERERSARRSGPRPETPYLAKTLTAKGAYVPNYYAIGHLEPR